MTEPDEIEIVRRNPGLYLRGTDGGSMHRLVYEILNNAMDEAIYGYAKIIEVELAPGNRITITDNGRGIPVDEHPKFLGKSALEVILAKSIGPMRTNPALFNSTNKRGVGMAVINALTSEMNVEVARDQKLYRLSLAKGVPQGPLEEIGPAQERRGTTVSFVPDPEIFGPDAKFDPAILYDMAKSKAAQCPGVEIRWKCDPALATDETPAEDCFQITDEPVPRSKRDQGKIHVILSPEAAHTARHLFTVDITPEVKKDRRKLVKTLKQLSQATGLFDVSSSWFFRCITLKAADEDALLSVLDKMRRDHGLPFTLGQPEAIYQIRTKNGVKIILEPVMGLEITAPKILNGPLRYDIYQRYGTVEKSRAHRDGIVIKARVPLHFLFGYNKELEELSRGQAKYTMEFIGYFPVQPEDGDDPDPLDAAMAMRIKRR